MIHIYLAFSTNPNNSPTAAYTTGVTTTGTPGTDGAKQQLLLHLLKKLVHLYYFIIAQFT